MLSYEKKHVFFFLVLWGRLETLQFGPGDPVCAQMRPAHIYKS